MSNELSLHITKSLNFKEFDVWQQVKCWANAGRKIVSVLPYLREALWYLGYAVDTLETAVDWHKVTPYMTDVEQALRSALQDENEHVLAFSHFIACLWSRISIYTTYVYRVAGNYQQTYARWQN